MWWWYVCRIAHNYSTSRSAHANHEQVVDCFCGVRQYIASSAWRRRRWACYIPSRCLHAVFDTMLAILQSSPWFALLLASSSRGNFSWILPGFVERYWGSLLFAIAICLGRYRRLIKTLLTMMWNAWFGRTSATPRAASVSCHSTGTCCGATVIGMPEAAVVIMNFFTFLRVSITCQVWRTGYAVIFYVVNGG